MVIRDLTLRSAASFGSFHLIRLLYDEYMFYLVEHRVAEATGETPIAVMGEVRDPPACGTPGRPAPCGGHSRRPEEETRAGGQWVGKSSHAGANPPGFRPASLPLEMGPGTPHPWEEVLLL